MTRKSNVLSGSNPQDDGRTSSTFPGWILDICLDYFITVNPFLSELRQLLLLDGLSDGGYNIDYGVHMIQNMYGELKYRHQRLDESRSVDSLRAERDMGVHIIDAILSHNIQHESVGSTKVESSFLSSVPDYLREQFLSSYPIEYREQALETLRIIGQLSPRTTEAIRQAGFALLLPHHISTDEEIDDMLEQLFSFLKTLNVRDIRDKATAVGSDEMCYQTSDVEVNPPHPPPLPAAVTIARSSDDGFTPSHLVDTLQSKVLARVQEFINELSRKAAVDEQPRASVGEKRKLGEIVEDEEGPYPANVDLIVHDLREDAVEKCFTMFLNRNAAKVCSSSSTIADNVGIPC
jgi:hypothetical protein